MRQATNARRNDLIKRRSEAGGNARMPDPARQQRWWQRSEAKAKRKDEADPVEAERTRK